MGAVFVVTLGYAFTALLDPVAVYFGPATQPDVMYPARWYVTLIAISAPVLAWGISGLGRAFHAIAEMLAPRSKAGTERDDTSVVRALVFSWTLAWFSGTVWLAIKFGNSSHLARSFTSRYSA